VAPLLPRGLDQLEARAKEKLSASAYAYYADAAYADAARTRGAPIDNERAWQSIWLRPRVLVDVRGVSTATRVLGEEIALPVMLSPCAFAAHAHPEAESGAARGACAAGTLAVISTASSQSAEEIAKAAAGPLWFQLYTEPDRGATDERVARAQSLGYRALVFTVDAPVGAPRYSGYPELGFGAVATGAQLDPSLDWRELERIAAKAKLPVVVKGVLHPFDAAEAAQRGVRGIVVSNHGGRQLDGVIPTARALGEIADAVAGRLEIYVDGGIRSARDVLRALALGARAAWIGRPWIWALALGGAAGVQELLDRLREELRNAMMLTGQLRADAVARDIAVARGAP
jgi:isopentenyl diphosphate isomerase/L-lactate dehydrogenase-like FMN-dependent dehydrogenase